jgi:hypothetical protein
MADRAFVGIVFNGSSGCKCEIEAYDTLGCVTTYGDGQGMVIGYFTKDVSFEDIANALQACSHHITSDATSDELTALQENALAVIEIVKTDWYMKYVENGSVYVLQVIVT